MSLLDYCSNYELRALPHSISYQPRRVFTVCLLRSSLFHFEKSVVGLYRISVSFTHLNPSIQYIGVNCERYHLFGTTWIWVLRRAKSVPSLRTLNVMILLNFQFMSKTMERSDCCNARSLFRAWNLNSSSKLIKMCYLYEYFLHDSGLFKKFIRWISHTLLREHNLFLRVTSFDHSRVYTSGICILALDS